MNTTTETLTIQPLQVVMISIVVLYIGNYLNKKFKFLESNYIPPSVTGGLLCSILAAFIYKFGDVEINFDLQVRDFLRSRAKTVAKEGT